MKTSMRLSAIPEYPIPKITYNAVFNRKKKNTPAEEKMIIAVDFDNTIARTTFPEIHDEIPDAISVLRRFQQAGHIVILWTCREGKVLNDALLWLADHGFTPDCVNCHSEKQIAEWENDPRKVGADVYIDDRNALCEIDWNRIKEFINSKAAAMPFGNS